MVSGADKVDIECRYKVDVNEVAHLCMQRKQQMSRTIGESQKFYIYMSSPSAENEPAH